MKLHPSYNYLWIRWYAGDFLALIVCAPLFTNFQIILKVRTDPFIKLWEIGVYWLLFSVVFEVFSPLVFKRGYADIWDVVAYGAGGLLLYFSQFFDNRKTLSNSER